MAQASAHKEAKNMSQAEEISEIIISHLRRQYRINRRKDKIQDLRRRWSSAVQRLTGSNLEYVTDDDRYVWGVTNYRSYLNKCTMYYYTRDVQRTRGDIYDDPGAAVCKRWWTEHADQPNVDWGRYFAYPFLLDTLDPLQLPDVVQIHENICDQAVRRHQAEIDGAVRPLHGTLLLPYNSKLYPLCRALLIIQDNYADPFKREAGKSYNFKNPGVDKTFINRYGQKQTVVIVRTGNEKDLSIPISFFPLADKALPLNYTGPPISRGMEVIRVSLYDAVDFITSLQKKEEEVNFRLYHNPRDEYNSVWGLPLRDRYGPCGSTRYPHSENEFIAEVLIEGKWLQSVQYINKAKEATAKLEAGDPDWDVYVLESKWAYIVLGMDAPSGETFGCEEYVFV